MTPIVLKPEHFKGLLRPRGRMANKGDFGHVLVIGGDYGYGGAAIMTAEAAAQVGAGRVSLYTHELHVSAALERAPYVMCHSDSEILGQLIEVASVIAIGPGLGRNAWGEALYQLVLAEKKSCVVDADALYFLAQKPEQHVNWILTPHPGEAARLLKTTAEAIQGDRIGSIQMLQKMYGGVVVLKGAGTLISAGGELYQCDNGNPGMATAGMGDILTGVIAGLVAQGLGLLDAARYGIYLHAKAGDMAARSHGERGLVATDLLEPIRQLVNEH